MRSTAAKPHRHIADVLASVLSRAQSGIEAPPVTVEVHVGAGLPQLSIVGLADSAVREARDRVRTAIKVAGFDVPAGRITVNLAPADVPKVGSRFDLPIAIGLLMASKQLPNVRRTCELYGELSLSGDIKPVRGMLPAILQATVAQHSVIAPEANLDEAVLVEGSRVAGARHLLDVCAHLRDGKPLCHAQRSLRLIPSGTPPDLADVCNQTIARRALEIAAAGGHNLLFIGPPGTGKSMLAHRLPGILPPMSETEALETAAIASVSSRGFQIADWGERPFRAPHHTASVIALTGGGGQLTPGEISLAHHGVLFLDELPEFARPALEALREPLDSGTVALSRAAHKCVLPARFQLAAAMNPCPCGYLGDQDRRCRCTAPQIERYRSRISGPFLDRMDLHVLMQRVPVDCFTAPSSRETSATVRQRVLRARELQLLRQRVCNAHLDSTGVERHCAADATARTTLASVLRRFGLSARGYHRLLKIARTLADLDGVDIISDIHVSEATIFRQLDRSMSGRPAVSPFTP